MRSSTLYIVIVLCGVFGAFIYKLRVQGIFACPSDGYALSSYMADCQAGMYGDYDHGALWYGLEPAVQRSAAEADVLFLGSSRLQFAFSGAGTAQWFSSLGAQYFLLGFSATENIQFVEPLLSKIRPRPKAIVINVDQFFDDRVSPPAGEVLRGGNDARNRYKDKQSWQYWHMQICKMLLPVCGSMPALFRSRETGAWRLYGNGAFKPSSVSESAPSNQDRWAHYAALGERFLSLLPVKRECVILTIVPSEGTRRAEAAAIAASLRLPLVTPVVDSLWTFDGSHLNQPSAERWAASFFQAAGPRIRSCLPSERAPSSP